jgi:hypothetical protein
MELVAIVLIAAGQDLCRATYRRRNVVERLLGRLKEHRRIATLIEKLASGFLAMVKLSLVRRYFRTLGAVFGRYAGENHFDPGHPGAQ